MFDFHASERAPHLVDRCLGIVVIDHGDDGVVRPVDPENPALKHFVHGANLGIRASAYLAAGGFKSVRTAEDHALVATFPAALPAGWRAIGRVLDGPARVLVDGAKWDGNPGWQSF